MVSAVVAAWLFGACIAVLTVFQLALAAGAPWGSLAMGGRFPGRFPPPMRVAALVQVPVYAALAAIVFARAGVAFAYWFGFSATAIWVVVAISAVALVLNLITPSRNERRLWAPVAALMLAASLRVALEPNAA